MRAARPLLLVLLALSLPGCQLLPSGSGGEQGASRSPPPIERGRPAAASPQGAQCLAQLSATGASYTPLPDRFEATGCMQVNPVALTSLQGDATRFTIGNIGPVTCQTANVFAGWARFGVDRAARVHLGSRLARIETFGSYACRNIAGSTRRSAHARAEAIDVAAFVLEDGRRISIADDWNGGTAAERQFLRVVLSSACKRFGTVLSPEYNAAHADHLHMEVGGQSFCR